MADGTDVKTRDISYSAVNQKNFVAVEGFLSDKKFDALRVVVTQYGVEMIMAGSTLPNNSGKHATIASTDLVGKPYSLSYVEHKGVSALAFENNGLVPLEKLNPYQGKKGQPKSNYNTCYATGIRDHYGWHDAWRGSMGYQTVKPGSAKGYNSKDKVANYKSYMEYMNYMILERSGQWANLLGIIILKGRLNNISNPRPKGRGLLIFRTPIWGYSYFTLRILLMLYLESQLLSQMGFRYSEGAMAHIDIQLYILFPSDTG